MIRYLLLLIFVLVTSIVYCQNQMNSKPDYDLIKMEIKDSGSQYFYPLLMKRMVSFDASLNIEDFKHLYYGYLFQQSFEPFMTTFNEDKLVELVERDGLKDEDSIKIFNLAYRILSDFPFDLHTLRILRNVYRIIGNSDMYEKLNNRYCRILEAIYSTGDGKSKENAIHLISVNHELEILNQSKLEMKYHTKVDDFDCITAYKGLISEGETINLYFYTGQIYK